MKSKSNWRKITGSADRPRLRVFRSLQEIYAQVIDDKIGKTLVAADSRSHSGSLTKKAVAVGTEIAKAAITKKIKCVVYDRGRYAYMGAVKELADAARKEGLDF